MLSPLANEPMLVLELAGIEIDYCPLTHGIWLDGGELEVLLGHPEAVKSMLEAFQPDHHSREKKVRCPICRKKMEKVMVAGKVTIDRCILGHGIWFDEGELIEVLKTNAEGDAAKVIELLKNMFENHIGKEKQQ